MATCLFTSETLSSSTKLEHTILKALGGRITSREVVSDNFNAGTGKDIDCKLADQFKLIIRELAPFLSTDLRKKRLKLESDDQKRSYYKTNGIVELAESYETIDPLTGIKYIVFPNEEELKKYAQSNGIDLKSYEYLEPVDDVLFTGLYSISPESHLSVIKCILTSFDVMLARNGYSEENRFTRLPALIPIRNFILSEINKTQHNVELLDNYFLGIDFFNCKQLLSLLRKYFEVDIGEFDHVMVVTTNKDLHVLIASWCILGLENHYVKLCDNWAGDSFSMIIVNSVIENKQPILVEKGEEIPFLIGHKNLYKAFCHGCDKQLPVTICQMISKIREYEYYDTITYVEMHADDLLKNVFGEIIKIHKEYHTLKELALDRIYKLFCSDECKAVKKLIFESLEKWDSVDINDFESVITDFIRDYRIAFEHANSQPLFHPGKIIRKM